MDINSPTLIHHFLEKSAEKYRDKVALTARNVRASYEQINSEANKLARLLLDHSIKKGDRVVLILENCPEYVVSYYGVLKTGAVVVPLGSSMKPATFGHLLIQLNPGVLICSKKSMPMLRSCGLDRLNIKLLITTDPVSDCQFRNIVTFSWEKITGYNTAANINKPIDSSALATIIYTSGSSGTPKGVMLSHENILANTKSICQYLKLTEKDIQMVVLPFFYVMGKSLLNTMFSVGGSLVINNQFAYPSSVIEEMIREKVTCFSGVPSTYAFLLHRSSLKANRDKLNSLRLCSQAGGHMSASIKLKLLQVLPDHTNLYIMYGATEASARLSYLEPELLTTKINSIGRPIPGVQLKVFDANNKEAEFGKIGELVANGRNIMQGYWNDPEATAAVLKEKGYHTGDLGYRDEEGDFFLTGRKDSLLKVGGHRIYPQEIEDAVMETDLVVEVAVIGIKDSFLGHKLIAIVAPVNGAVEKKMIMDRSAARLPRYKLPADIKMIKALPKKQNGKIDRNRCRKLIMP